MDWGKSNNDQAMNFVEYSSFTLTAHVVLKLDTGLTILSI